MAKISLNHIYKDYSDDVRAVTDFNLEIDDEEFIVLVGPSGCGKSTTLRMIAGLEDISSGEIIIDGRKQNELHPKERDIAMVFQNYALYPHMTVFDNLAFGLKMRNENQQDIERRVREAAEILDIDEYLDRKPAELSGGQRQRVALGRAIVREPKVFLMDEPLSNLDAKLRFHTRAEITKLHRRLGVTTIYVTHDQTEAMSMATRIVVMNRGLIQQIGTPKEIYMKPNNIFVGQFIGSPAMNFIPLATQGEDYLFGTNRLNLPMSYRQDLALNTDVILGIRPEALEVLDEDANPEEYFIFEEEVVNAELMGSETLVYIDVAGHSLISKVQSMEDFTVGETIRFGVPYKKLHFFDKETELRIPVRELTEVLV